MHGGIPNSPYFRTSNGSFREIGRLVPIVNGRSALNSPFEPFAPDPSIDRRIYQSLEHILGRDESCFFSPERLIPFAALVTNDIHPDFLDHTNTECDFVCFDRTTDPHSIVVLQAYEAANEFSRHEEDFSDDLSVDYETFIEIKFKILRCASK